MSKMYHDNAPLYWSGFIQHKFMSKHGYHIEVGIWYPTADTEDVYDYLTYIKGSISTNAQIAVGQFPLVVISSGYAGNIYDQSYLAEELARNGFIVASVSHIHMDKGNKLGCIRAWYRCYEIKESICSIQSIKYLNENMLHNKIFAIGFSAGTFSTMLLTGATPNFTLDNSFMPYSDELQKYDFTSLIEPRITKICLFAPVFGHLFDCQRLQEIYTETMILEAEKDEIAASGVGNYKCLPNVKMHEFISDAGHFVFNAEVTEMMKRLSPINCKDIGIDRKEAHPIITQLTLHFFNEVYAK